MIPAYHGKDINKHICNIYVMSDGGSSMENKMPGECQGWEGQASKLSRLVSDGFNEKMTFSQRPERDEGISPIDVWEKIESFINIGKVQKF